VAVDEAESDAGDVYFPVESTDPAPLVTAHVTAVLPELPTDAVKVWLEFCPNATVVGEILIVTAAVRVT
jgi:hypothetical protein